LVALALGLSACQTSSAGSSGSPSRSQAAVASTAAQVSGPTNTLDVPIHLFSIYNSIEKGRVVDNPRMNLITCESPVVKTRWALDANYDSADQMRPRLREAFREQGLDLIEDQYSAFVASDATDRADILLAGVITDFSMRSCYGGFSKTYAGDANVTIRWEAYSQREDKIFYEETIASSFSSPEHGNEIDDFLDFALDVAASDLASSTRFRQALAEISSPRNAAAPQEQAAWEPLTVSGGGERAQAFTSNPDPILDATVVLVSGSSHGSGFVVSEDGYILTNAHVVGKRDRMTVRFRDGREYEGRILRRHGERDVALVKIDATSLPVLPLRTQAAKVGEAVFSIGAPQFQALESTVSSGIVSAYRAGLLDGST
jgi:hypothetical protein